MLKKKLEEARKNLAETKAAVEAGEKTADDLNEAIKAVETAQKNLEAAEAAEKMMKSFGTIDKKSENEEDKKSTPRTLGDNFVEFIKNAKVGKKFNVVAPVYIKAATDTQTSPSGAVDFATTFDRNVVEAARVRSRRCTLLTRRRRPYP